MDDYKQYRVQQVDNSPWKSFVEFTRIAGKWWLSVWVLIILAGFVTLALTIADITQLPKSVWGILFAIGIVIAPIITFHILRIERDTYNALWDDKATIIKSSCLYSIPSERSSTPSYSRKEVFVQQDQ